MECLQRGVVPSFRPGLLLLGLLLGPLLPLEVAEGQSPYVLPPAYASGGANAAYVPPTAATTEAAREDAPRPRRSLGLLIAGPIVLAVPWLLNGIAGLFAGVHISFGSSGAPDDARWDAFRWAGFIPLFGPWIELAIKPTRFDQDGWGGWLVLNGLLQATGLGILIAGIVQQSEPAPDEPYVSVLPTVGPDGAGLSVSGRF